MNMTEGLNYISVRVCRIDDQEEKLLEGSGTLFEDNGNFYVLTAYHCLEKEVDGVLVKENLDLTRILFRYHSNTINVSIIDVVDQNPEQDWALIKVERPTIDWKYEGKLKLTTKIVIGETYESYPYVSAYGDNGRYVEVVALNENGDCHISHDLSTGRYNADVLMKGGSGAGVMMNISGTLYCFGFMKETLPFGQFNDVRTVCINDIIPLLSKSIKKNISTIELSNENERRLASYANQLAKSQTNNDLKLLLQQLLGTTIPAMIDSLQDEHVKELLDMIDKNCGILFENDKELLALYYYNCSQYQKLLQNAGTAGELAHIAYTLDSSNAKYIAIEVKRLWETGNYEDAKALSEQLPKTNLMRVAIDVYLAEDQKAAFDALPHELRDNCILRYHIIDMFHGGYGYPKWLVEGIEIREPWVLSISTLPEWMFFFTQIHYSLQGIIPLMAGIMPPVDLLKKGFDAARRYFSLAQGTKLETAIPILTSLYYYWGFLLNNEKQWYDMFIKVPIQGDNEENRRYHAVMQSSMLSIMKLYDEAYNNIINKGLRPDPMLWAMVAGISCLTQDISYLQGFADYAEQYEIEIDSPISEVLIQITEAMPHDLVLSFLERLHFKKDFEKQLLGDYSRLVHQESVSANGYDRFICQLTGILPAIAASVMFYSGEKEQALEYLKTKFAFGDGSKNEQTYYHLLSIDPAHQRDYYQHLEGKLKIGEGLTTFELRQLYNYMVTLQNYKRALEILEYIRDGYEDDEFTLTAYIDLLGKCKPEDLTSLYEKAKNYNYMLALSVETVYYAFASNGMLEQAAEILYEHTKRLNDDSLNFYYIQECVTGYIARVSHQEYDLVSEDNYIQYTINDSERFCRRLSAKTILGAALMGKKKDDTIFVELSGEMKKIHIIHICNKFGYLYDSILKNVIDQGGNDYLHPISMPDADGIDAAKSLLKQLETINKEERENYQKAVDLYHNGQNGLYALAKSEDLLSSYYYFLFSKFKLHLKPFQSFKNGIGIIKEIKPRIILDITSLLLLFEFKYQYGIEGYRTKFLVPRMIYNLVGGFIKKLPVLNNMDFFKAMEDGYLYRFSNNLSENIEKRVQALKEWIEQECEIVSNPSVLNINVPAKQNEKLMLFQYTIIELLYDGDTRILLTEDHFLEEMMKIRLPIVSTETYIYEVEGPVLGQAFTEFLIKNHNEFTN